MKTLNFTVGLLLLVIVHCAAMPHGVNEITPGPCCFQFFTGVIPRREIISVAKTHRRCFKKAFVISTANGKDICVSQTMPWARSAFDKQLVIKA